MCKLTAVVPLARGGIYFMLYVALILHGKNNRRVVLKGGKRRLDFFRCVIGVMQDLHDVGEC